MPQLFDIPQPLSLAIAVLVPLLTTPISGWLQDDGLPAFVNAALVVLYLLATAALCWAIGGKITGVLPVDAAAYFAVVYLIAQTDQMQALEARFMVSVPSPFAFLAKKPAPVTPVKLRASQAITLAPGRTTSLPPAPIAKDAQDVAKADTLPRLALPEQPLDDEHGG